MKRKSFCSITSFILGTVILMTGCATNVSGDIKNDGETNKEINHGLINIGVPYEPLKFEVKVEPYMVKADLSNIENLNRFGEFSKEQLELIVKNNFVVNPTKYFFLRSNINQTVHSSGL